MLNFMFGCEPGYDRPLPLDPRVLDEEAWNAALNAHLRELAAPHPWFGWIIEP